MFFSTDRACYFKNERMRELDSEMGDLSSKIADIEIELAEELFRRIKEYDGELRAIENWLAYIDWQFNETNRLCSICAISCAIKEHQ